MTLLFDRYKYDAACLTIIGILFAFFTYNSWMRWSDLLIDFGREIYIPWRLIEGDVLYRDIMTYNGPFSYCMIAASFRMLGESLVLMAIVNMLMMSLFLLSTYVFFRKIGGRITATACCLIYLVFFAFGHFTLVGNYNWVFPYSMSYVHGVTLAMFLMTFFQSAMVQPRSLYIGAAGAFFGLVLLTRMEVILAGSAAAIFCFVSLFVLHRPSWEKGMVWFGIFFICASGSCLIFLLAFRAVLEPREVFFQIVGPFLFGAQGGAGQSLFYERITGIVNVWGNLKKSGIAILKVLFITGLAYCLDRIVLVKKARNVVVITFMAVLAYGLYILFDYMPPPPLLFHGEAFSGMTLIIGVAAFGLFLLHRKGNTQTYRYVSIVAFAIFSIVLLLKILLQPGFAHYGFVLGSGAGLLLTAGLLWLPISVKTEHKPHWIYLSFILLFLAADGVWGYKLSERVYNFKTSPVESVRGEIIFGFPRHVGITKSAPLIQELVQEVEKTMDVDANFTVFPEGALLNYLTRRKTPMPYVSFMPTELARRGESEIIRALIKTTPDFIVLSPKNPAEFGVGLFGRDPRNGMAIMRWVGDNYHVIWREGPEYGSHPQMGSMIYKRNADKDALSDTRCH